MSKNLLWITDGAGDIGTSSDQRPSNAYIKNLIQVGGQILIGPTNIQFNNQSSTPSNPASGKSKLYFKSDGKLYKLSSAGVVTEVGAGSALALDGSTSPTADISWGNNKITSLSNPTSASDAATKDYVDTAVSSVGDVSGPVSATDNSISRYDGTTGKIVQNSGLSISDGSSLLWNTDGVGDIGASGAKRPNISYIKSRIILEQTATPSNPPANNFALYFKSDGNLYKLNSSGVETVFSAGGGVTFPLLGTDGSASAPTYSFASASNYGMYYASNTIGLAINGTGLVGINSSVFQSLPTRATFGPASQIGLGTLDVSPTIGFNATDGGFYGYISGLNSYMGATIQSTRLWEAGTNYGDGNSIGVQLYRQMTFPTHAKLGNAVSHSGEAYLGNTFVGTNGLGNGAGVLTMRGTNGSSSATSSPIDTNIVWQDPGSGTVGRSDGASPTSIFALNSVVIGKPDGVGTLGNSPGTGLGGKLLFQGYFGRTIEEVGTITFRTDEQTVTVDCLPTGASGGDGVFYFRTGSVYNDNGPGVADDTITAGTAVSPPAGIRPGSIITGEGYSGTITSITYLTGDPQTEFPEGPNPGMTLSPPYPALQRGFVSRSFKVIQQRATVGTSVNRPYNVYSKALDIGGGTLGEGSTISGSSGSRTVNRGGDVTVKGGQSYQAGVSDPIVAGGDLFLHGGAGDIGGKVDIVSGQNAVYSPINGSVSSTAYGVTIKSWDMTGAYAATNGGHVYTGDVDISTGGAETIAGLAVPGTLSINGGDASTQGIANQHYQAFGGSISIKAGNAQSTNNTFTLNDVVGGDITIEAGSATAGTAAGALNAAGKVTIKSGNASASSPIQVGDIELLAGSGPSENGHILLKAATNQIALYSGATVNTTDATITTAFSKTLADNTVYFFTAKVSARQTNSANRAVYERKVCVYREAAGSATIQGTVSDIFTQESNAAWDCTWDVTGNTVRLRITGDTASDISWVCSIEEQKT